MHFIELNLGGVCCSEVEVFYQQQNYGGGVQCNERVLAAYHQQEVVGAAKLEQCEGFSVLRGVYVDQAFQGQGIGRKLITLLLASPATVYCLPKRHLQKYYQSFGFECVDALPDQLRERINQYLGAGIDVVAMRKP
ncbi:GNAT family N-acetyltransferase [Salinibius halmophilus]|uniref:GNAT family N-acetyltransferase n=1 Tax=Salinibius halmophilus TaxID=1853216 RepID=UPI000E674701|nr:GNAT family N-acetyltransferase [Salinibius halmophilus]